MTTKSLKKCTLFLKLTKLTDSINYTISPEPSSIDKTETGLAYNFLIDVNKTNNIKIIVDKIPADDSAIIVNQILVNGYPIDNLNAVSYMKTVDGQIKKNYGYIDCSGEFNIKIRTNLVSLNYLNYLLSLTI